MKVKGKSVSVNFWGACNAYPAANSHAYIFYTILLICFLLQPFKVASQYQLVKPAIAGKRYPPSVLRVVEGSHGFMWYLTHEGLYRYDGQHSVYLQPELTRLGFKGIPEEILIDRHNRLWLAAKGCFGYLDIKSWKLTGAPVQLLTPDKADDIRRMKQLSNGTVIVGYKSGYLLLGKENGFQGCDAIYQRALTTGKVTSYEDAVYWKNAFWISTTNGLLFKLNASGANILNSFVVTAANTSIVELMIFKGKMICKRLDGTLYFFDGSKQTLMPPNNLSVSSVRNALNDRTIQTGNSFLYLNKRDPSAKEVVLFSGDSFKRTVLFTDSSGILSDVYVNSVIYNPISGNFTLGTSQGIFILFKSAPKVPQFNVFSKFANRSVRGIYRFPDGDLFYAGYSGSGLTGKGHSYYFKEKTAIYCMLPLDDHRLLLGIEGGFLSIFDKKDLAFHEVQYYLDPQLSNSFSRFVFAMAFYAGKYYLATANGVWTLDALSRRVSPLTDENGVPVTAGLQLKRLVWHAGLLYIASQRGCYTWNGSKLSRFFPAGEEVGESIYDIAATESGLWLATLNKGLIHVNYSGKETARFDKENGLNTNVVFTLLNAGKMVIAGTDRGLLLIKKDSIRLLGKEDGLQQLEFNHSASLYDAFNNIAFIGGLDGYTVIDLAKNWFPKQRLRPIYVGKVEIRGSRQLKSQEIYNLAYSSPLKITLKPWQEYVSIDVATPYSYAQKYDLEYMLVGLSDYWQTLEEGQPISLLGLARGHYLLRIRTIGDLQPGRPVEIAIEKLPAFYQTWWFQATIILLLSGVAGLAYRNRIRKARHETMLRTRIASDLHDEVGSVLTGIALQADFLFHSDKKVNEPYLKQIAESSREAILTMGDIVWSIDARNDNVTELLSRMRDYLLHVFEPQGIKSQFDTQDYYPAIPQLIRQNTYLIFKEAINNISKHSGATFVKVSMSWEDKMLKVMVSDNGKGIKSVNEGAGQGLNNMKMRAGRMRAKLFITSGDSGTIISLEVPLIKK